MNWSAEQSDIELYPRWKEDLTYMEGDWVVEEGRFLVLLAVKPKWIARNMMIAPDSEVTILRAKV